MDAGPQAPAGSATLQAWVVDAHARIEALLADLSDAQLMVPRLPTINPLTWESCHAAFFYERFVLQESGRPVVDASAATLYDSIAIAHDTRWDLPVPDRASAARYRAAVRDRLVELLGAHPEDGRLGFLAYYGVLHADMHAEAITYCRQTCGYPAPSLCGPTPAGPSPTPPTGDVEFAGGTYQLGAAHDVPFCFDNEKWAHPVTIAPFAMARAPVTQAEFAAFVDDGGYARREWWTDAGWAWRHGAEAAHPVYWRREPSGRWQRRDFDRWVPLEAQRPVIHVNAHEADAYAAWAGRRLPTEAEWEYAATGIAKRPFPWGEAVPGAAHANLEWAAGGCIDVGSCPSGDTPEGVTGLLGDTWEWCADTFGPYPGFTPDHYGDYSVPLFGNTRVLRGGCWVTRRRLARPNYRNYTGPHRRNVFAGFRTCAR